MPTFVLILWPVVPLAFFALMGPARGLIWSTVIGYLFLPENIGLDLSGLPLYDKRTAISFGILLSAIIHWRRVDAAFLADRKFSVVMVTCLSVLIVSSLGTYLTNQEVLVDGPVVRRAVSIRDVISIAIETIIGLVPLLIAWRFLRTPEMHRELLIAIVAFGLIYSLLALFELRVSPQLNKWVYGYFQHNFRQHLRGGGFRPIVFLRHGLWLGFFLLTVTLAAMALTRSAKHESRAFFLVSVVWCALVLALSRNLGATMLALLFLPTVMLVSVRGQVRIAAAIAIILLLYPLIYQIGFSPSLKLLEFVETQSPQRAQSLKFRLDNEQLLLGRAFEKPWFGWGGWSRPRVFDELGRDQTVTDGLWIIVIGARGWVGYLMYFGLLCLPIVFLLWTKKRKPIRPEIAGMAVIMGANYIYVIPNSTLSPIGLIIIGAVASFVQYDTAPQSSENARKSGLNTERIRNQYTRFGSAASKVPQSKTYSRSFKSK